jgi:hypothetical protein
MKIYAVFTAENTQKFHDWALSHHIESHYRTMSNGNLLALADGNIKHEDELTGMGYSVLPPLEERESTIDADALAMFPAELGILPTHNTHQAMKVYSDKTGTRTFHPRR